MTLYVDKQLSFLPRNLNDFKLCAPDLLANNFEIFLGHFYLDREIYPVDVGQSVEVLTFVPAGDYLSAELIVDSALSLRGHCRLPKRL